MGIMRKLGVASWYLFISWMMPALLLIDNFSSQIFLIYVAIGHVIFFATKRFFNMTEQKRKYLLGTGFFDQASLASMSEKEIYLRAWFQNLKENKGVDTSNLSVDQIKRKNKAVIGDGMDVLVAARNGLQGRDADDKRTDVVCINCGHKMYSIFSSDNPCVKVGKKCVDPRRLNE